jgi:hypothetical protein
MHGIKFSDVGIDRSVFCAALEKVIIGGNISPNYTPNYTLWKNRHPFPRKTWPDHYRAVVVLNDPMSDFCTTVP